MEYHKLSLVVPVYNEEKTLPQILNTLEAIDFGLEKEVILIDDGSTDGSSQILNELRNQKGYVVLENEKNMGKSQTVKKGILHSSGDLVVIQDADLEYDPNDLKAFLQRFTETDVDVIYGNRFNGKNKVVYWKNWFGNRFLSFVSSMCTGPKAKMWTSDMEVCYKMAKGGIFRQLAKTIESTSNFGFEPEITAAFAKYKKPSGQSLSWVEIPITYRPRTIEEGKHMRAFKHGFAALFEILKFNLFRK